MKATGDTLDALVERVRQGDYEAKAQLRQELRPPAVSMVRQVLERGAAQNPTEQKILAVARRLFPEAASACRDRHAASVADALCRLVANSLWPGCTAELSQETLSP